MSVVQEFRNREIARLERSGWATNAALREVLDAVGLRPPAEVVAECLDEDADGAFHRRFLRESRGFVEPGWDQVGCWISVVKALCWETRGGNRVRAFRNEDKRVLVGTGSDTQRTVA